MIKRVLLLVLCLGVWSLVAIHSGADATGGHLSDSEIRDAIDGNCYVDVEERVRVSRATVRCNP